ncbi:ATP-binding protein [Sulfurimonas sp.]|nr:ATP-binding protein [Sulfurimonas sp.]
MINFLLNKWLYLFLTFILTISVYYIIYTLNTLNNDSDKINNTFIPTVENVNYIQLEHAKAHLWFEELLSGDDSNKISDILKSYDQIEKKIITTNNLLKYESELYPSIINILESHSELKKLLLLRYKNQTKGMTGTISDQKFDSKFLKLLAASEKLNNIINISLNNAITRMETFKIRLAILLFIFIMLLLIITVKYISFQSSYKQKLIDEVKKKTTDLRKAKELAEDSSKTKSEFLANMSHEIRTPMNSIIGFAEILNKKDTSDEYKLITKNILNSSKSLLIVINDILDLSKIEAGKMTIIKESASLTEMFMEIENIFILKSEEKGIKLFFDIDDNFPNYLLVDISRIRQILINLLGNAIKFTPANGKVVMTARLENKSDNHINLFISVKDTGIGIPQNELSSIFEAFIQKDGQNNRTFGGTGLGLSISNKLSKLMNGTINVVSEENIGSEFTLQLDDIEIDNSNTHKTVESIDTNMEIAGATILIVDDIQMNRTLVSLLFEDHDVNLIEAENGQIALDVLQDTSVDLILMDIQMPIMDGFEATNIIRQDNSLKSIPVIALTASVMKEEVQAILDHDFNDYLEKPINTKLFYLSIKKHLSKFIVT